MSEKLIQVRNLVDHIVVIPDPEMHRKYSFQPYEVKKIDKDTLRRLAYRYGVLYLFRNSLCVEDEQLAREFGVSEDTIEYKWTQKDIDDCLLKGSLDQLLDALDFAPEGIIDTLVQRAVELKISDTNKREAIKNATGFDVDSMIRMEIAVEADEEKPEQQVKRTRRTAKASEQEGRRVQA